MEDNTSHGTKQLPREILSKSESTNAKKVHQKQDKNENKKLTIFT